MRKILIVLMAGLFITTNTYLFAAGNAEESATKVHILKLGINTPEKSVRGTMAKTFKDEVEKNTNGRYKFDLYYGETLGSEPEQLEGVKVGSQDFTIAGATLLGAMNPVFNAMTLPFMVSSFDDAHQKLDGSIGQYWDSKAPEYGYHILAKGDLGFNQITNNKHPINSLNDMKGLNMRTPNDPLLIKTIQALGASATPMSFSELYMALSQGVVDGQFNPVDAICQNKFNEVQKYLAHVNLSYITILLVSSEKFYSSLSPEDQKIFTEAGLKAQETGREYAVKAEADYMKEIAKSMQVTEPDQKPFKNAVKSVYTDFEKGVDPEFAKLLK